VKISTLVLGVIAAACAAASIYLGSELSAARDQLALETQARIATEARIRQLEGERRRFETVSNQVSAMPGAPSFDTPPPVAAPRPLDAAPPAAGMPMGPPDERLRNVYDTPAGQNTRRLQQEIRLRRTYADMPAALGLDAAQADKLFDLLADSRVSAFDDTRAYEGDRLGRQALEAAAREQRDAQINALLGPDKAAEFQAFEKSIPARMQVNRIGERMAAANVPLTETQRNSLIAAVASERETVPAPIRPTDASQNPDHAARLLEWQEDFSRRVQARIEPLMTAEQVTRYREAVQVQNAQRAAQRARAEARRNAPGDRP
jgi:hypothetical protein